MGVSGMPNAQTHDAITVATGLLLAPLSYVGFMMLTSDSRIAAGNTLLLFGMHLLSGVMFSPDLDLDSAIDDRWGVFFWIWRPYMWLVPHRHRWLSHGLIVAPLFRLAYFCSVVSLLVWGIVWAFGRLGVVISDVHVQVAAFVLGVAYTHFREVCVGLLGFITGGAVHTIADWLVTGGKRYLHRLGFRIRHNYTDHDRRYRRYSQRRRSSAHH